MTITTRTLSVTADLARLQQRHPERYPFLLASTASALDVHRRNCRYDILLALPQEQLLLDGQFRLHGVERHHERGDFLASLNNWIQHERTAAGAATLPFTGGWFIYLAYELAQQVEPCLHLPVLPAGHPAAVAVRVPAAIIVDHLQGTLTLVAESEAAQQLDTLQQDIEALAATPGADCRVASVSEIEEDDAAPYYAQIERLRSYIHEGDIFQANLSRRWLLQLDADFDDRDLFTALAATNPSSFACLVKLDTISIISSSPERLVQVRGHRVQTRPIAGTRPRGVSAEADEHYSAELLAHPKERAEHIMLIDLERNDLGRVCTPGSIEVDELLVLESWQHVHHIVSNIRGSLRPGVLPGDVLRAVFPGGTITGCPKVRCMEILAELEQQARSAYTGTLGYINRDGSMDTNILIRTMIRQGDQVTLRAGGGVVADSDAGMELAETRAKARGLLEAFAGKQGA